MFIVRYPTSVVFDLLIYRQGHSTGQTTGIGGHMAARFIPTVERESVDLVLVLYISYIQESCADHL